jgi:Rrf2 family iron-sulfur cluster assembly transcriptional regulator
MKPTGTRELNYALRAMVRLADAKTRVTAADIANSTNIPPGTLRHILDRLRRAHLVSAQPSRQGGFLLARPSDQITVLDVVEAFEGSLEVSECPFGHGPCIQAGQCAMHSTWESAWRALRGQLACCTVAGLADQKFGVVPANTLHDLITSPTQTQTTIRAQ